MAGAFPRREEHVMPALTRPDGSVVRRPAAADPDGPLVAEVVKTTTDPYVGRVSLVRVFSGTLRPDPAVHVCGHGLADRGHPDHDVDERIGALVAALGKTLRAVDDCRRRRHLRGRPSWPRRDRRHPVRQGGPAACMAPWTMPEPLLPIAIVAQSKADEDKLSTALRPARRRGPDVRLDHNPETGQLVLWCMGEAHADVLLDRLATGTACRSTQATARPAARDVRGPAKGHGRHVKQSGGHGQYAICHIEVEPLPAGAGFEFVDKVVGGAVPR